MANAPQGNITIGRWGPGRQMQYFRGGNWISPGCFVKLASIGIQVGFGIEIEDTTPVTAEGRESDTVRVQRVGGKALLNPAAGIDEAMSRAKQS